MKLNIYNNFRAFYYNTLVNFYLYFNTLVPYYDDVILSLSITSFKNIINNSSISLKSINQQRMMQLLYLLNDKDKIVIDDDGFVFIDYRNREIIYTDEGNEIIQDNSVEDTDIQEHDTDIQEHDTDTQEHEEDTREQEEDTREQDTDTQETTNNYIADPKTPFVYTEDIVIENGMGFVDNNPVMDNTQDIVVDDTLVAPIVYTQDLVIDDTDIIDDTDNTKSFNSLDKKNN